MMPCRKDFVVASLAAVAIAASAAPSSAQVVDASLTERGRPVSLRLTDELVAVGRTLGHGLLATARRDVTRPVTDAEVAALGRRGTLLRIRLSRPETVALLRLGARARASRLAAYVPPRQDEHAFVFLGRSRWDRIVVVDLPDRVRTAVRRLRADAARTGR